VKEPDLESVMLGEFPHLNIIKTAGMSVSEAYNPKDFAIYPNPMNGSGHLRFTTEAGRTRVSLFNSRAQEVMVFYDGQTIHSTKELKIETNGLSSGTYHIRLQTGDKQVVKQIQIVK
jgi:hypothetical protein